MNFMDLIPTVDKTVDAMWAERIVLQPWAANEYTTGKIDSARNAVQCFAVYMMTKTDIGGLGGSTGGGFLTRVAEQGVMLSIQQRFLDQGPTQKGDLVKMIDRGIVLEISQIEPSDTERPILHLLRMRDDLDISQAFQVSARHQHSIHRPNFKLPRGFKL